MTAYETGPEWRFAAASVTGQAHVDAGGRSEDAWFCGQSDNSYAVGVVSDGAGSAPRGGFAAQEICAAFASIIAQLAELAAPEPFAGLPEADVSPSVACDWSAVVPIVHACLAEVREKLIGHAQQEGRGVDDYLATVLAVIAYPGAGGIIFHVGDGAATAFGSDGAALSTSQPENGEFLNETYFLVDDEWEQHCRRLDVPADGLHAIFLMTDGVTDLAYHREGRILRPEARFFQPLSEYLEGRSREEGEKGLRGMLDTERARQLVNDDKTLVWMRCPPHGPASA